MKRAIILADERSERVVNGSGHVKALAKVAGLPLIIRNLRTLHAAGIDEAVVVTGYQSEKIRRALDSYHLDIPVTVVHNDNWKHGSAHSIIAASGWINQQVVLVPSDHLYPPSLIRRILNSPAPVDSVVLAVDRRCDDVFDQEECLKVRLEGNTISDFGMNIERPDGVCPGIVRISPDLVDKLKRLLEDVEISLEDSLRAMARRGRVRMLDVKNVRWISISSPQARRYAELLIQLHGDTLETSYDGEHAMLLNPGPVTTTPRVKAAVGARDMCHREPIFSNLLDSIQRKLRRVFKATDEHDVFVITASGTGGMESAISTFVPHGKKFLVLSNGAFGERLSEIADVYNIEVVPFIVPWGQELQVDSLDAALAADPDIAAVGMIHHETSMAVLNPVGEVGAVVRKHDRLLIVDAVSSLGAEQLDVVADEIDVCVTSANKCLHAFSGVASVCVHPRVWSRIKDESPRSYYLDLRKYHEFMTKRSQTPFTPGVNTMMSLNAALDELLDVGVESRMEHYVSLSSRLRNGLRSLGMALLLDENRSSHSVTIVKVPDGLTYSDIYHGLKSQGYIVYESKGELAGSYFQVANMGALEEVHIDEFLSAMGKVLSAARTQEDATVLKQHA
ncbi:MAG: aminotransferase class V-fold PLP-dependent enzyme [Deltaproteobacteria bacterium]|nr:aminotransferase class V-fold PLP-dependent enzyme [Deltaproteobacteria bacterium]MBN2672709.1 aminotransferase class V-fold PLP-dependent enzyme [Deltaproteobacteria bacterium]